MNADLDQRLRSDLRRAAATSNAPHNGRQLVERRIEARRTRRRRVRHAVTAVSACGALLVAAVVLNRPADDGQVATGATADPAAGSSSGLSESTPTVQAVDGLPHLVVDHPEFAPVLSYVQDVEIDRATFEQGAHHIQTFRTDPDAWSLPAVTLLTTSDPSYGIGESAPAGVTTTVDINGSMGYLVNDPAPTVPPTLGWRLPHGTAALIVAPGLSPQELVEWALTLTPRDNGQGWEVPRPPAGLSVAFDGALSPQQRYVGQELTFGEMPDGADANPIFLDTHRTTPARHEERVHDRLHSADHVDTTVVRDRPAAVVRSGDQLRVLWSEQGGTITNELVLHGMATDQLDSIIASLTVLGDDEWNKLLADTAPDR